eukprot:10644376-Alexandrium_andersonii.AAC.1
MFCGAACGGPSAGEVWAMGGDHVSNNSAELVALLKAHQLFDAAPYCMDVTLHLNSTLAIDAASGRAFPAVHAHLQ